MPKEHWQWPISMVLEFPKTFLNRSNGLKKQPVPETQPHNIISAWIIWMVMASPKMKGKEKSGFIAPPCKTILKLKHISAPFIWNASFKMKVSHRKPPLPSSGWKMPLREMTRTLSGFYPWCTGIFPNCKTTPKACFIFAAVPRWGMHQPNSISEEPCFRIKTHLQNARKLSSGLKKPRNRTNVGHRLFLVTCITTASSFLSIMSRRSLFWWGLPTRETALHNTRLVWLISMGMALPKMNERLFHGWKNQPVKTGQVPSIF